MVICVFREENFELALDAEMNHSLRAYKRYGNFGLEDFVIIYFVSEGDKQVPLVTYDLAHGFAHRDLRFLPAGDKRRKKRLEDKPLNELFDFAFEDVLCNWHKYFQEYKSLKVFRNED